MKQLFWGYTIDDNTVVRQKNGTILKSRSNNKGYHQVSLVDFNGLVGVRRWYLVHRLVAHVFCHNPRPDVFDVVDHIDGDPTNNLPVNLRWVNQHLNSIWRKNAKCAYYSKRFKKWLCRCCGHRLGWFKTQEEATMRANKFRKTYFAQKYKEYLES